MAVRHDIVQPAKPLVYGTEFEGLLQVGQVHEMMAGAPRGRAFRQILLSAESQARVEIWREYAPAEAVKFSAAHRGYLAWYVGDDAGNLHHSTDGMEWRIVHRFGDKVTGIWFDNLETGYLWVSTYGGEIWRALTDLGEPETWDWVLAYSNASYRFVGLGICGGMLVAAKTSGKDVVRCPDSGTGEWEVAEVFAGVIYAHGVAATVYDDALWVASYTTQPYWTADGLVFHQTTGSTPNAVSCIDKQDGIVCAGGPTGLWRSDDDGATWTTVISLASGYIGAVAGGIEGWVALSGDGGVYESSDSGLTWTLRTRFVHNRVWAGANQPGQVPVAVAMHDEEPDLDRIMAIFEGGVMLSRDNGVGWRGGCNGDPWRISIEAYRPELLDVLYEIPPNQRLVGAADVETFVLVSS